MEKTLNNAAEGERLLIKKISCEKRLCARLADLGLIEGTVLECVGKAPMGDPAAFLIRGAVIALRRSDTEKILAEEMDEWSE